MKEMATEKQLYAVKKLRAIIKRGFAENQIKDESIRFFLMDSKVLSKTKAGLIIGALKPIADELELKARVKRAKRLKKEIKGPKRKPVPLVEKPFKPKVILRKRQ